MQVGYLTADTRSPGRKWGSEIGRRKRPIKGVPQAYCHWGNQGSVLPGVLGTLWNTHQSLHLGRRAARKLGY